MRSCLSNAVVVKDPDDLTLLESCCEAATACCRRILVTELAAQVACPPTWDGWQCWERGGQPGTTPTQPCPHYIYFLTHGTQQGLGCNSKPQ